MKSYLKSEVTCLSFNPPYVDYYLTGQDGQNWLLNLRVRLFNNVC